MSIAGMYMLLPMVIHVHVLAHLKDSSKVHSCQLQSDQSWEELQTGDEGTALEEGGDDQVQDLGEDVHANTSNGLWSDSHHGTEEGEH